MKEAILFGMTAAAVASALIAGACVSRLDAPPGATAPQAAAGTAAAAGTEAPAGIGTSSLPEGAQPGATSLYDLALEGLTDSEGRAMRLDAQRGHPVVVSMFYASCPSACPALLQEMRAMDAALTPAAREDVRYLLVSFDPARDDTASLAKARATHGLDRRWTLARTDEREVRLLATALGLRYRFREDGEIDHSTNLTLVRPDGTVDVAVDGLGQGKEDMIRRIGELSRPPGK